MQTTEQVHQVPTNCPDVERLCGDSGMLVLTRHVGEDIVIQVAGYTILVRNLEVRGDKTRTGIKADRTVKVHRREVWEAIHSSQEGQSSV